MRLGARTPSASPGVPRGVGAITLHYSDCSTPGRYLDQWSGGKFVPDGASRIVVTAGRVRSAGRVTLRATSSAPAGVNSAAPNPAPALPGPAHAGSSASTPGTGAIAGKVTGRGKPLKGICVDAFPRRGGRGARVKTTKSGTYRVGSLKPGRYLVVFFDCTRKTNWLGQYYRGVEFYSSHRRPTAVPVRAGKTTRGINAKLELGGEIDGTVRNKDGQPLPRICAEAIGGIGKRFVFGGYRATDANGRYVLHGVTPASYQVHFSRCGNPGNYAPVWWRHSQTMAGATKIVIKSGQIVQHIDPVMPAGGVISGTVRAVGPSGKRLRGICVFAEGRSVFSFALTNRSGNYRLIGLTSGKYRLFFQRCRNRGNYLPTRRSVKAILGHTVSVDAFLPLGAIGTGVVTDSHGDPIAGICVEFQGHRSFGGTRTRSDGTYSVNALRSGPYKIQFTGGCGNSGSYAPQFYHGATNVAAAKQIDLTAGKTTRRINASMRPGATIAGTVTDAAGNRVNDVCISIVPLASLPRGFDFGNLTFAYRGAYAAENLAPGMYAVNFGCFYGDRQLAVQWFMGQASPGSANPVSAPAGVVTSGIDATLQQNGSITGTVTNRSGTPLAGICVEARAAGSSGTEFFFGQTFTVTRKNGTYSLSRVPPGSYVIQYVDCRHRTYGSRWYKQKASPQTGTPVTVTPGGTASGIDETLALGGSISGVVKTSSGMPVRACVEAFDATTESDGFVLADRTGHYTIKGLSTGSYQVAFFPCERSATPLAEAMRPMPVAVKAPAAVTGINGKLGEAGSISGAVRDGAGKLQAGVCIAAVPADPGNGIAIAETGQDGTYEIGHLGPGTYHVYLGDAFCGSGSSGHVFAPQWFKGQQSLAMATDVTVTAGNATAGISAGLGEGGTIRGTVTHQGQPVAGECVTAVPVKPTPDPLLNQTLNPVVAVTTSSGNYSLVDLLPGQYDVKFSIGCGDSGFATQWWQHAASEQSATTISVSANGTVTGIDANLP